MMKNGLFLVQDIICLLALPLGLKILDQDLLLKYIMVIKINNIKIYESQIIYFCLVNCVTVLNGEIGFCSCHSCSNLKGDCDFNNQCNEGLRCGSNNCPDSFGFVSHTDCCYTVVQGDDDFCTIDEPCGVNEGDCDSNDECKNHLFCGSNNCLGTLDFLSASDCCEPKGYKTLLVIF